MIAPRLREENRVWSRQLEELVEIEKGIFYTGGVGGDQQVLKNSLQIWGEAADIANAWIRSIPFFDTKSYPTIGFQLFLNSNLRLQR